MNRRSFVKGFAGIIGAAFVGPVMISHCLTNNIPLSPVPLSFTDMLNAYLPKELIQEELMKRNELLLYGITKDHCWAAGELFLPEKV